MCGITGFFSVENNFLKEENLYKNIIKKMADTLAHRGPDDESYFIDENICLGFKRLSIIDIEKGNQPHFNENRTVVSVCNGEIFNFNELKKELANKGHKFRTFNDTEVLVHLYEEYGFDLCDELDGQFAFLIYDRIKKTIFAARDNFGVCPFFYTIKNGTFYFASEIKALLKHPNIKPEVNLKALDMIFTFPGIISPYTMFKDIFSLKPGCALIYNGVDLKTFEYWDLNFPLKDDIDNSKTIEEVTENLEKLLTDSVKKRLLSDVPVGLYVSGGLDSSLVTGIVHSLSSEKRETFSIKFKNKEIDESNFQDIISKRFNTKHNFIEFDWEEIIKRIRKTVFHTETPLKESYDTCSIALSERVRKNSIKVIQTGEGADELFGGYVGYVIDKLRDNSEEYSVEAMMDKEIREQLWGDPDFFYEKNLYEFREIKQSIYSPDIVENFNDFECTKLDLVDKNKVIGRNKFHQRSYIDFKFRIADHLLSDHGDRVVMANSVEARYPFLDKDMVAYITTIPPDLMTYGGTEKYILKKIAKKYIPPEIVNRQKFAFVAPSSPYLLKNNKELFLDLMSEEKIKREGFFNHTTINRLIELYEEEGNLNQTFENDLLMIIFTFEIFLEEFGLNDF